MKRIIDFITEKFKINSKTVTKQDNEVVFDLNKGDKFPTQKEIDIIENLTYKLPLLPDKVYTSNSRIVFRYNRSPEKQTEDGYHIHNSISIHCGFINSMKKFSISFSSIDQQQPIRYEAHTQYIEDCFKSINFLWKRIDFSEVIEKYR